MTGILRMFGQFERVLLEEGLVLGLGLRLLGLGPEVFESDFVEDVACVAQAVLVFIIHPPMIITASALLTEIGTSG